MITFGDMVNHTSNTYASFYNCSNLKSISLPQSLTGIGIYAFQGCSNLTTIKWSDSLKKIRYWAFYGCSSLDLDIDLPNLEEIGGAVFWGTAIRKVLNLGKIISLPSSKWDEGCFYGCQSLQSVLLPETLKELGQGTFRDCTALNDINLPSSITNIGDSSFINCTSLAIEGLSLPNLETLGVYAFAKTQISGEVNLPNLKTLGEYAFGETNITKVTNLGSITSTGGNWDSGSFAKCSKLTECVLPETLVTIGLGLFYQCANLSKVNIPESVQEISANAFDGCTSLYFEELNTPNLVSIGNDAVKGLKVKKWLNLGKITSIGVWLLDKSTLEEIVIPNTVTSVASYAFQNCTMLKTIVIPDSVTNLGSYCFKGCTSLLSVVIGTGVTEIASETFHGCNNISSMIFPNELTTLGNNVFTLAFNNSENNIDIVLPNVTSIGTYCFSSTKINKIVLNGIVGVVSHSAFRSSSAEYIELGESVTGFAGEVFSNCTSLQTIILHSITPPSLSGTNFYQNPTTMNIYVPDESLTAYKEASGWSAYADRIKPISETD